MALIACSECGRQISEQAGVCPGCGAPPAVFRGAGFGQPTPPAAEQAVPPSRRMRQTATVPAEPSRLRTVLPFVVFAATVVAMLIADGVTRAGIEKAEKRESDSLAALKREDRKVVTVELPAFNPSINATPLSPYRDGAPENGVQAVCLANETETTVMFYIRFGSQDRWYQETIEPRVHKWYVQPDRRTDVMYVLLGEPAMELVVRADRTRAEARNRCEAGGGRKFVSAPDGGVILNAY
jgi:hypothetical protein